MNRILSFKHNFLYITQYLKILNAGYLPLALAGGNRELTSEGALAQKTSKVYSHPGICRSLQARKSPWPGFSRLFG
jgi:hypothetical protein